jgi:hypothetical protein
MYQKSQIIEHVQSLESHQVKALVLEWLASTETDLNTFEQLLGVDDSEASTSTTDYGEFDDQGNFQPLNEAERAVKSLKVLEEYQQTREGVTHERVLEWLDNFGSRNSRL